MEIERNNELLTIGVLNNVIQNVELNSAKNQDKFVKNLVDTIGKFKTEITECLTEVQQEKCLLTTDKPFEILLNLVHPEKQVQLIESTNPISTDNKPTETV